MDTSCYTASWGCCATATCELVHDLSHFRGFPALIWRAFPGRAVDLRIMPDSEK